MSRTRYGNLDEESESGGTQCAEDRQRGQRRHCGCSARRGVTGTGRVARRRGVGACALSGLGGFALVDEGLVGGGLCVHITHGDAVAFTDGFELRSSYQFDIHAIKRADTYGEWRLVGESSVDSITNSQVDGNLEQVVLQDDETRHTEG